MSFIEVSVFTILLCNNVILIHALPTNNYFNTSEEPNCNVTLDFSRKNFDKVYTFISSPFVKKLDFSHNNIDKLGDGAFDGVPNILELDLSHNKIPVTDLFSFGSVLKLKTLDLSDQIGKKSNSFTLSFHNFNAESPRIRDFTHELRGYYTGTTTSTTTSTTENPHQVVLRSTISVNNFYPNLENLFLRNLGAKKVSTKNWMALMPKLQKLDLSSNRDLDLEDLVKNFPPSLKTLSLKSMTMNTLNVSELHNLATLRVDHNDFSSLHFTDNSTSCESTKSQLCIGWMMSLSELSAFNCKIEELTTKFLFFDAVPNLKILNLYGNRIKTLAHRMTLEADIPAFSSMQSLDMTRNSLNTLQQLRIFPNLRILHLDNMRTNIVLSTEDAEKCWVNLTEFSFTGNGLSEVPKKFFGKFRKLEKLNLSGNKLKKFPLISNSSKLKEIDLSSNQIENLDDLELRGYENLEMIDLRRNRFSNLNVGYLKTLPDKTNVKMC